MFQYHESRLRFTFDTPWAQVHVWDKLPAYTGGLARLASTAAVDFIGLYGTDPFLIEVKNFCDYRIENKTRLSSGELVDEIAGKVRDTVAGLAWSMDRENLDSAVLTPILRQIFAGKTKCSVVLWLEEDPQLRPVDRSILAEQIKRRLRWLNPHVAVRCRRDPLPGLMVDGAPPEFPL